jgi:hypothetical protein
VRTVRYEINAVATRAPARSEQPAFLRALLEERFTVVRDDEQRLRRDLSGQESSTLPLDRYAGPVAFPDRNRFKETGRSALRWGLREAVQRERACENEAVRD